MAASTEDTWADVEAWAEVSEAWADVDAWAEAARAVVEAWADVAVWAEVEELAEVDARDVWAVVAIIVAVET